jgi:hypothetical protein
MTTTAAQTVYATQANPTGKYREGTVIRIEGVSVKAENGTFVVNAPFIAQANGDAYIQYTRLGAKGQRLTAVYALRGHRASWLDRNATIVSEPVVKGVTPVFAAESPNHYAIGARKVRAAGMKCAFRGGQVFVWWAGEAQAWTAPIKGEAGYWLHHGDLGRAPWTVVPAPAAARLIERDCYCISFPEGGCDFCNNVRSCDGEREAA